MNKKTLLFSIILFTAFVVTSILAIINAKKVTQTHISSANNPDFFMTNATYTKFDQEGNIRNQVNTKKIIHFANNNVYLFEHPKITIYNPNEQPWYVTAEKGRSEKGKDKIYLWDKVKIIRSAGINNPDFDITTPAITIYPATKFAETEQPITIIQSGNVTKSVGAKADFKTGIIKLLSKIEGLYMGSGTE